MASMTTLIQIFRARVARSAADAAFEHRDALGSWVTLTWAEVGERVRRIACGLRAIGAVEGDRVALLCGTRIEWILADLAILDAGCATTTIYPSSTASDCVYILGDSGAAIAIVENAEQLAKVRDHWDELEALQSVVVVDGDAPDDWALTLAELEDAGLAWDVEHPGAYDAIADEVGPEALACLIYTSGTTGEPKGVMLVHDCFVAICEAVEASTPLEGDDKQYLWLPLSHVFGKICEIVAMHLGVLTAIDGDLDYLLTGLQETRPTMVAGVPRFFEKVHARIRGRVDAAGGVRKALFDWAVGVGKRVAAGEGGWWLGVQHRVADRLVLSKVRAAVGGRLSVFVSGGAPLAPEIAEFFRAFGMLVLEGYGMTETCAVATANKRDAYRFGTVGKPGVGVEVRIAEDGEILIRGRGVMRGYWNKPEQTAETLVDGWLHTGDIGVLGDDGFLRITDRKKDLIVTAGGKNVAPQKVENLVKARSPMVSQVVMHGDQRKYCVALVTLDADAVTDWAARTGVEGGYEDLVGRPELERLVWQDVEAVNADLASFEAVKKIAVLPRDLTIEAGELTPSMKVRRKVVEERYRAVLDGLYG